jgi:hypothetical protein
VPPGRDDNKLRCPDQLRPVERVASVLRAVDAVLIEPQPYVWPSPRHRHLTSFTREPGGARAAEKYVHYPAACGHTLGSAQPREALVRYPMTTPGGVAIAMPVHDQADKRGPGRRPRTRRRLCAVLGRGCRTLGERRIERSHDESMDLGTSCAPQRSKIGGPRGVARLTASRRSSRPAGTPAPPAARTRPTARPARPTSGGPASWRSRA